MTNVLGSAVACLLVGHGLIHLLGVAKGSDWRMLPPTWCRANTRPAGARGWRTSGLQALAAPRTEYIIVDHSGQNPPFDELGRFADLMPTILTVTEPGSP